VESGSGQLKELIANLKSFMDLSDFMNGTIMPETPKSVVLLSLRYLLRK